MSFSHSSLLTPDDLDAHCRQHGRVVLEGPLGAGKTTCLIARARALTAASPVLVLASRAALARWREAGPDVRAFSLAGFMREELSAHWPLLEAAGAVPPGSRPRFVSWPLAPFALGLALGEGSPAQARAWAEAWAAAAEHGLPAEPAEAAGLHRARLLAVGLLDPALQARLYAEALWPLPAYQDGLRARARHVILDGLDRPTPLALATAGALAANAETAVFALDQPAEPDPALEAWLEGWKRLPLSRPAAPAPLAALGEALACAARGEASGGVDPAEHLIERVDYPSRRAMLEAAAADLQALLASGVAPHQVAVMAPALDQGLRWQLAETLARRGIRSQIWSEGPRFDELAACRQALALARLARPDGGRSLSRTVRLELLEALGGLAPLDASRLEADWPWSISRLPGPLAERLSGWEAASTLPIAPWLEQAFETWIVPGPHEAAAARGLVGLAREAHAIAEALAPGHDPDDTVLDALEAGWWEHGPRPAADPQSVTISSAWRYALEGQPVRYQFWLDAGEAWAAGDDGPESAGRCWWRLCLRARGAIAWYGSRLDALGQETPGPLLEALERARAARPAGLEAAR